MAILSIDLLLKHSCLNLLTSTTLPSTSTNWSSTRYPSVFTELAFTQHSQTNSLASVHLQNSHRKNSGVLIHTLDIHSKTFYLFSSTFICLTTRNACTSLGFSLFQLSAVEDWNLQQQPYKRCSFNLLSAFKNSVQSVQTRQLDLPRVFNYLNGLFIITWIDSCVIAFNIYLFYNSICSYVCGQVVIVN